MKHYNNLDRKIKNKSAKIAIIGMGYVGLPLAVAFAEEGFKVTGLEVNPKKADSVNRGESYVIDISNEELKSVVNQKYLRATTDFSIIKNSDVIIICVPTPLRKSKDPDISFILESTKMISKFCKKGQLVILESTTYPGTTREVILPEFTSKNMNVGKDFFIAFSPERVDPGNPKYGIRNTPKVIGGITKKCGAIASKVYNTITDRVVSVSSAEIAEMVKLLENTFRAVNIGLVNEMALLCNHLKLNVWEVIEAAATKPFGFMPFFPGPGLGGHCIPIDPHYLSWKLKELNVTARFIELADEINSKMPEYVTSRISEALNTHGYPLKKSRILLLGMAYKKNVSDVRESPAIDIVNLLKNNMAAVDYHDPYVKEITIGKIKMKSVPLNENKLSKYHAVVIVTDHKDFNIPSIVRHSRLLIDARNSTKGIQNKKIIRI